MTDREQTPEWQILQQSIGWINTRDAFDAPEKGGFRIVGADTITEQWRGQMREIRELLIDVNIDAVKRRVFHLIMCPGAIMTEGK